jgi:predicted DNA-binding protein (UPF0251 family)
MKKQQRYTPEFRAEAVKLVSEQGLSQETAAKRLAIPKGTGWRPPRFLPAHQHLERVQQRNW